MAQVTGTYVSLIHESDPQFLIKLPETLEETVKVAKDRFFLPDDSDILLSFAWDGGDAVLTDSSWEFFKTLTKDSSRFRLNVRDVNEYEGMGKRKKERQQTKEVAEVALLEEMRSLQVGEVSFGTSKESGSTSASSSTTDGAPTLSLLSKSDSDLADVATAETRDLTPLKVVATFKFSGVIQIPAKDLASVTMGDLGTQLDTLIEAFRDDTSYSCEVTCPDVFKFECEDKDIDPSDSITFGEWIRDFGLQQKDDAQLNEGLKNEGLHFTASAICKSMQ